MADGEGQFAQACVGVLGLDGGDRGFDDRMLRGQLGLETGDAGLRGGEVTPGGAEIVGRAMIRAIVGPTHCS
jgi:hypothetical protein